MTAPPPPRANYNRLAHLYDSQPYREKPVDPHLLAFLAARPALDPASLAALDMACGTGNQLVANRTRLPRARLAGLDVFGSMLNQARRKTRAVLWVQADAAAPPFPGNSFHYISNQFAFHHVRRKRAMLRAVFRLLRPGGQFVMTNIAPHNMTGWLCYRYFPAALAVDRRDFLSPKTLTDVAEQVGFVQISLDLNRRTEEQDLRQFAQTARRRDTCSQLTAISDADYRAGLRRLEADLRAAGDAPLSLLSEVCLLTLKAGKGE